MYEYDAQNGLALGVGVHLLSPTDPVPSAGGIYYTGGYSWHGLPNYATIFKPRSGLSASQNMMIAYSNQSTTGTQGAGYYVNGINGFEKIATQ